MTLKKYVILIVFVISLSILSAGGGLLGWKDTHGTIFHLNFGSQTADLNSLNDMLATSFDINYPNDFIGVGAQYFYINNNLILGAEGKHLTNGNHIASPVTDDNIFHLEIDGNAGFFDIGYVLYTSKTTFIAPWIGIGMGSVNFSLMPDDVDWISAFENLENNSAIVSANRTASMLNWGICMDFIFRTWAVGASLGYMHTITDSDWKSAGKIIEFEPKSSLTGIYFNLNIGYSKLDLWTNITD